jgi:hypothetical protein
MATNPSTDEHKIAIKKEFFKAIENDNSTNTNIAQQLGEKIGQSIGSSIIDNMIERENYVLDAIKPTLNLSISDKLNKNNLMQRTLIYNTKDFPLNIENNMFSIWNHFKENY